MPELPEVETVRRTLEPHIAGKTIDHIELLHTKVTHGDDRAVHMIPGKTFSSIDRKGKLLIFRFKDTDDVLTSHLKMTGQFFYKAGNELAGGGHSLTPADIKLPTSHTRAAIYLTDGSVLYFNDMRLFGYIKLLTKDELATELEKYGPEPGLEELSFDDFKTRIKRRKTNIKAVLLNQKVLAGLGNIYVDESLFRAGIKPTRAANGLKNNELEALYTVVTEILPEAIAMGGTTFNYFSNVDGRKGSFIEKLQVFTKQDTPCPRCGTLIEKTKLNGRGTHFCPNCQK